MALEVPEFADPRDPANPIRNAYVWLSFLTLDLTTNEGAIVLTVNPHVDAWQAQPVARVPVALGRAGVPSLPEMMADPEFLQAFNTIGSKLYGLAAAHVPTLAGATPA